MPLKFRRKKQKNRVKFNTGRGIARKSREYTLIRRLSRINEALRDLCLREKKKVLLMQDPVYEEYLEILTENRIKRMKRKAQSNCAEPLQTTVQALGQLVSLS